MQRMLHVKYFLRKYYGKTSAAIFAAADYRKEGIGPYKRVHRFAEWKNYDKRVEPEKTAAFAIYYLWEEQRICYKQN